MFVADVLGFEKVLFLFECHTFGVNGYSGDWLDVKLCARYTFQAVTETVFAKYLCARYLFRAVTESVFAKYRTDSFVVG
jgi:hypothetical protein